MINKVRMVFELPGRGEGCNTGEKAPQTGWYNGARIWQKHNQGPQLRGVRAGKWQ